MKNMNYQFVYLDTCAMCRSDIRTHSILGRRLNMGQGFRPQKILGITTSVVKCNECGLIMANPQPQPKNVNQHYEVKPEDYWHDNYFEESEDYMSSTISRFRSLYRGSKKVKLKAIDIGAGIGKGLNVLTREKFDVIGIEPSPTFINRAREKFKFSKTKLICSTVENAKFADNSFDFILIDAVLEHLLDPFSVLAKTTAWLKKDGLMAVEVPSSNYLLANLMRYFYRLTGSDYVINTSPMHPPFHLFEFTKESFQKNGKLCGYEVVCTDYYVGSGHLYRSANILSKILGPIMQMTKTGLGFRIWLVKS